jgi:hypothetical protein
VVRLEWPSPKGKLENGIEQVCGEYMGKNSPLIFGKSLLVKDL